MIGKTIGNLKIVSEIGEGGMGVMYLAEHLTLKKLFAVKSLSAALTADTNFRQRFYQEAQNQALLDHPNIVQAIDFFEKDDQFLFVMAYVNGQPLDDIIRGKGNLNESEALPIIKEILDGLNFAHSKGIIHRDIKPSNIIIDEDDRARITDFGIAILAGDRRLTATGSNIGSPWYMSPEQILRPRDVDHRSDVYSVGILLYEMLTGEVPFDGETDYTVKTKQVNSPVPDPTQKNADISPEIAEMIVKAMEKDPDERFATCGEFLECIEAYEKANERPAIEPHRKLIGVLATLAMAGIVLIASLFYLSQQQIEHSTQKLDPERKNNDFGQKKTEEIADNQDAERKNAYVLIETALDKVSIVCREFKELNGSLGNMKIAEKHSETGYVDQYRKQIQEHKQNIHDAVSRYREFIVSLGGIEKNIVDNELEKYTEFLAEQQLFHRVPLTRIVKSHDEQYRQNNLNVTVDRMNIVCKQQ